MSNMQFPKLAALMPECITAVDKFNASTFEEDDELEAEAREVNKLLEPAMRAFQSESLNSWNTLKEAFGPKDRWSIWAGFSAAGIGGEDGFIRRMGQLEKVK
jgi:hypothetical protein